MRLLLMTIVVLLFASGCVASRIGVSWPATAVVDYNGESRIVVSYNQDIVMVDPVNGRQASLLNTEGDVRLDDQGNPRPWQVLGGEYESAQFFARPFITEEETFLFPAYNDRILEVDTLTARIDSPIGIPTGGQTIADMAVTDELFIVPRAQGGLIALDRETYDQKWLFETDEGLWATPLVHENVVYVPGIDHFVYALDLETGELLWQADLEGAVAATPLLYDGYLYVGSYSHFLYKISLEGEIVGTYEAVNWIWSTPAVDDEGILYISDLSGFVHAVDAESMTQIWSAEVAERGIRPAPLLVNDFVIVASRDGQVYWLNPSNGQVEITREVEGRPEILGDILFVPADEDSGIERDLIVVGTVDMGRLLAAFTVNSGSEFWVFGR